MKLIDTKLLLKKAYENGYAVPAINVDNTDSITGLMKVCEEMKSPIIIQIAPVQVHSRDINYKTMIDSIVALGKDYDVCAAIHLDHGDSLEDLKVATTSGFNSVMFDGSGLEFEDNISETKIAREFAKNISLEGEIGKIGGSEGSYSDNEVTDDFCTNVEQAVEYVKQTKVDFLAVAIGNAHGIYKSEPKLNFERLSELNRLVNIPLVMHGASGLSENDIKKAVSMGIAKINFFTDVDKAFLSGITESLEKDPGAYTFKCFSDGRKKMELTIRHIIDMCKSSGKA